MIIKVSRSMTEEQRSQIVDLLEQGGLPVNDLSQVDWLELLVWQESKQIRAVGGLQRCGDSVLLRSIATDPDYRGKGIASSLINQLHLLARDNHFEEVYLLTTDAESYFRGNSNNKGSKTSLDYQPIEREYAPASIKQSSQFSELCPASAILMKKRL
ncbi:MAG: GNAT family N-acetyltransferase [Gammaproteobacteria bacterium]|nr:GNAT family N-acetyltransferase [Gammaproteobacteria bacterium]